MAPKIHPGILFNEHIDNVIDQFVAHYAQMAVDERIAHCALTEHARNCIDIAAGLKMFHEELALQRKAAMQADSHNIDGEMF